MPWKTQTAMTLRKEFITLAMAPGANITKLCSRFNVSSKTAYKWINRFKHGGFKALENQSRRPHTSPNRIHPSIEDAVISIRTDHETWGGRKIRTKLLERNFERVPSASTITEILRRNNLLDATEALKHKAWQRFEAPAPNSLWQMDFKGYFAITTGRCHPLTILDDYSRYSIGLVACGDQGRETVQNHLTDAFRLYGLPNRILVDNGSPWGNIYDRRSRFTRLTVWLLRLGIHVTHSRPFHPQTLGKGERFHRTLQRDVIASNLFHTLIDCQRQFDRFRQIYNIERPHEALDMKPPVQRYQLSPRPYPETLPPIEYDAADIVRKVQDKGKILFRGKKFVVGRAFRGFLVALRPTENDGIYDVYFIHQKIAEVDLNNHITD
jgi:transposase InsO family protein